MSGMASTRRAGRTGLYHCYSDTDELLYIGVSWSFGVRWQKHANTQPWWGEVRRQTVYWYDTRDEALDAEALAIFTEQPKYNVLHRKQAERLRRLNARPRTPAKPRRPVDLAPGWRAVPSEELPAGVSSMTIGPGVTAADLAMMDAIDAAFPDDTIYLRPGSRCHAVDWET